MVLLQLRNLILDIPETWGDSVKSLHKMRDDATELRDARAKAIADNRFKALRTHSSVLERACEGGDGTPWNQGLAPKLPWRALVGSFNETLANFGVARLEVHMPGARSSLDNYHAACSTLSIDAEELSIEKFVDKAMVTVATHK